MDDKAAVSDYFGSDDPPVHRGLPPPPPTDIVSNTHSRSQSRHSHHSHRAHDRDRSVSRSHSHSSRSRSHSRSSRHQAAAADSTHFDPHLQQRLSAQLNNNKSRNALGSSPLMPADIMSNLHLKQSTSYNKHSSALHAPSISQSSRAPSDHKSKHYSSRDQKDRHTTDQSHGRGRSRDHSRSHSSRSNRSNMDRERSVSRSHSSRGSRASSVRGGHSAIPPPFDRVHTASMSHSIDMERNGSGGIKNFAPQNGVNGGINGGARGSQHHQYRSSYNGGYQVNGSLYDGYNVPQMNNINSGVAMGQMQHQNQNHLQRQQNNVTQQQQQQGQNGKISGGAGKWFAWGVLCLIISIVCFLQLGDGSDMHESRNNGGMLIVGALLALLCMVIGFVQGCSTMKKENEGLV